MRAASPGVGGEARGALGVQSPPSCRVRRGCGRQPPHARAPNPPPRPRQEAAVVGAAVVGGHYGGCPAAGCGARAPPRRLQGRLAGAAHCGAFRCGMPQLHACSPCAVGTAQGPADGRCLVALLGRRLLPTPPEAAAAFPCQPPPHRAGVRPRHRAEAPGQRRARAAGVWPGAGRRHTRLAAPGRAATRGGGVHGAHRWQRGTRMATCLGAPAPLACLACLLCLTPRPARPRPCRRGCTPRT